VVGVLPPGAAWAATGDPTGGAVEISHDGTTWSRDLVTDLFDPHLVWVPGDVGTTTLYVRSRTCPGATGQAEVTLGPHDAALADDISVRTRVDGGAWSGAVSRSFALPPGQVDRLDVEVTYEPGSGNGSQSREVPLSVVVTVGCDGAPPAAPPTTAPPTTAPPATTGPPATVRPAADGTHRGPPGAGGSEADGSWATRVLAGTGLETARVVLAGLVLVLAGALLVAARRRRVPDA